MKRPMGGDAFIAATAELGAGGWEEVKTRVSPWSLMLLYAESILYPCFSGRQSRSDTFS